MDSPQGEFNPAKLVVELANSNQGELPFDHNYALGSALYRTLAHLKDSHFHPLHDRKEPSDLPLSNLIAIGPHTKVSKSGLRAQRFLLLVNHPRVDQLKILGQHLFEARTIAVENVLLDITRVNVEPLVPGVPPYHLVSKSPAVLRRRGQPITAEGAELTSAIEESAVRAWERHHEEPAPHFKVLRYGAVKRKLKRVGEGKVPCVMVDFYMDTTPEGAITLLACGLGAKTRLGFGYLEVERT